jgi:hypothetical protein
MKLHTAQLRLESLDERIVPAYANFTFTLSGMSGVGTVEYQPESVDVNLANQNIAVTNVDLGIGASSFDDNVLQGTATATFSYGAFVGLQATLTAPVEETSITSVNVNGTTITAALAAGGNATATFAVQSNTTPEEFAALMSAALAAATGEPPPQFNVTPPPAPLTLGAQIQQSTFDDIQASIDFSRTLDYPLSPAVFDQLITALQAYNDTISAYLAEVDRINVDQTYNEQTQEVRDTIRAYRLATAREQYADAAAEWLKTALLANRQIVEYFVNQYNLEKAKPVPNQARLNGLQVAFVRQANLTVLGLYPARSALRVDVSVAARDQRIDHYTTVQGIMGAQWVQTRFGLKPLPKVPALETVFDYLPQLP